MHIPWKLKSAAFRILARAPSGSLYAVLKYVTGRSKVNIGGSAPTSASTKKISPNMVPSG